MTSSAASMWDERTWLRVAAVAAVIGAVVAMGEGGFAPQFWTLLPLPAAAFVAKAEWPELPNLVVGVPSLAVPLVVNTTATDSEFSMFLLVLATVLMGKFEHDRRVAGGYLAVSVVAIFVLSMVGVYDWAWVNWIAALSLSWAFGSAVYRYDRVLEELEANRAQMVDQATLVERRRIARDVHDLVGHSLAVVLLHIAGARRLVRNDPEEAETALLQAEEAGRASMAEVRRTIGLMREDGNGGDGRPGPPGSGSVPTPDLTDVAGVVEQYRNAGLDVDYRVTGPLESVDGPRAVAGYRIVQEALANVSKHTVGAKAMVDVEVTDEACRLAIVSRGGRPAEVIDGAIPSTGPGHGLIGMRERALSVGGSLVAGSIDGGWSVEAVFPLVDGAGVR